MSILAPKHETNVYTTKESGNTSIYLAGILGGPGVILCKMLRTVTGTQLAQDICNYLSGNRK